MSESVTEALERYGYIEGSPSVAEAIRRFQEFNGLTVDADAGPKTRELLFAKRCGCSDIQRAGECKWPMRDVAYWHDLDFSGVSIYDTNRAFREGAGIWNKVCGINLHPVDNIRNANIYAHARAIDRVGGTLAWSFLPCGSSQSTRLEQRYDTRERWSYAFLRRVVMHEIGHAIGFDHNQQRSSIMYAYSNSEVNEPNAADIAGAIRRYGKPTATPDDPPPSDPNGPEISGELLIGGVPHILIPKPDYGDAI